MCVCLCVCVCQVDGHCCLFYLNIFIHIPSLQHHPLILCSSPSLCSPIFTHVYLPSHLPSDLPPNHHILSFMALQGAAKIMDGARSALGKAKQAAGKILDAAEEVGSVSAMAKKALGGLLLELHGSEDIGME